MALLITFLFIVAYGLGMLILWLLIRPWVYQYPSEGFVGAVIQYWDLINDPQLRVIAALPPFLALPVVIGVVLMLWDASAEKGEKRRGAKLVSSQTLSRMTRNKGKVKQVTVGGVPVPLRVEDLHFLAVGSTGSGKTNLQNEILDGCVARDDRLIVVDPNGHTFKAHGGKDDQVLNPFDPAAVRWDVFGEINAAHDYDRFAKALIPKSTGEDESWRERGRVMLSELMQTMVVNGDELNPIRLLWWVTEATRDQLRAQLIGTTSAVLLQPDAGRFLDSVRGVLATYLRPLQYYPKGDFTIHNWYQNGKGNLYIVWTDDQLAALKPLISCWIELLVTTVLSSPASPKPLWLFIDELASLEQIPSLETVLTKGRKYGIRVFACLQSISQLIDLYSKARADTLRANFRNLVVLGGSVTDPDTAETLSLGLSEYEYERCDRSVSRSAKHNTVTESLKEGRKRLVMPADIQYLEPNRGYLKFSGSYPVALIRVKIPRLTNR